MNKYKLRNVNPSKDRDIILEYNTRVCYECESKYFKEKGYDTYRKEWQRKENAERLWNMMLDTLKDKRNIAFIIESEDETTIGYFWAQMEDLSPSCLCMNIHDIYIEEPYRKQGIASELFTYAEELARKNGANLLRSGTSVDNIKSIALHEKAGFSKHRYEFEKILK